MRSRIQSSVVDYINKMLRYLLEDLCEKVYNGPISIEFRDGEIERIRLLIRPYLGLRIEARERNARKVDMRKIVNDSIDIAAIEKQFTQMLRENNSRLEKIITGNYNKGEVAVESRAMDKQITEMKILLRDFKDGKISVQHINEQIKLLTMQLKSGKEEGTHYE